jgi:hypothetical protein
MAGLRPRHDARDPRRTAVVEEAGNERLVAVSDTGFGANDVDFLNMMGDLEAPDGFGDVFGGVPALPSEALEAMTIGEVLDYQRRIQALGTQSSAVGRYQFIHDTLARLVNELGISPDLVFDGEVRTFLARVRMSDCGFYDPATPSGALGNCLAGTWAALPLLEGPRRGQSAYEGDGLNHALVNPATVVAVLDSRFTW